MVCDKRPITGGTVQESAALLVLSCVCVCVCVRVHRCSAAGPGPEDPAWHRSPGGGADDYFRPDQSRGPRQRPESPATQTQVTCSNRLQQTSSDCH